MMFWLKGEELLRHSTIQSTMNVYTQAVSEGKRAANNLVVRSILQCGLCGDTGEPRPREPLPVNGTQWYRVHPACSSCNRAQVIRTVELGVGCGGWI